MAVVDVYLYNYNIYDLADMSILGSIPKEDESTIYKHLYSIKDVYNIKFAVIDFNQPLRNALYSVFHMVIIIIHPYHVTTMINNYLNPIKHIDNQQDEIAATSDNEQFTMYASTSKQEAIGYYRQWQGEVPLGVESFHNVITKIDYYYEEVFNYFDFKNIFI